jgi:hypothetical protein
MPPLEVDRALGQGPAAPPGAHLLRARTAGS